jgi:DtxR family Mn-dependent transcriptional regulator
MSMLSENVEEYLEAVCRLVERGIRPTTTNIAKALRVSYPSVSEMLRRLDAQGFLKYEPYRGAALTPKGRAAGKRVLRKHRLIERFLYTVGLSSKKIHQEACKLEHSVSDDLETLIEKGMEKPVYRKGIINLADMQSGQDGEVISLDAGREAKRRLEAMGLTPGTKIRIARTAPFGGPVEITVRGSCLALGRGMANRILVKVGS